VAGDQGLLHGHLLPFGGLVKYLLNTTISGRAQWFPARSTRQPDKSDSIRTDVETIRLLSNAMGSLKGHATVQPLKMVAPFSGNHMPWLNLELGDLQIGFAFATTDHFYHGGSRLRGGVVLLVRVCLRKQLEQFGFNLFAFVCVHLSSFR
jgi:hypothetical protein